MRAMTHGFHAIHVMPHGDPWKFAGFKGVSCEVCAAFPWVSCWLRQASIFWTAKAAFSNTFAHLSGGQKERLLRKYDKTSEIFASAPFARLSLTHIVCFSQRP